MRTILIVAGTVVVLTGLGIAGWLAFGNSIPSEPPYAKGTIESVSPNRKDGGLDVVIPNFRNGNSLYLWVPANVPIRRRDGGTAELKPGQTVSVWIRSFGNSGSDAQHLHLWADATFVAIESDG
jgi:hypothetical protein